MYLTHFGLKELPFGLTPDTQFAFAGRAHQEGLNTLLVAVEGGEGFIKITGEVGTGKTLLCRRFLKALHANRQGHVSAYLPNPCLDPRSLLLSLAEELGELLPPTAHHHVLVKRLNDMLLQFARAGKRVVVCIDEAQALPLESLEALRLLSNLETEKHKLLQLVLFGQPELHDKLARREIRQLRQRIAFAYELSGLQRSELDRYLLHRLQVAGYRGAPVFSAAAVRLLHHASRGIPRLVNVLAHKSMLSAYGEGRYQVGRAHVRAAVGDTEGVGLSWWRLAL
ncbi:MAG: AAA family ATPase [Burkholderiaceae bacterium]|nr:MAG: AAA family ATPase [Burkholderiaceae bacterium]